LGAQPEALETIPRLEAHPETFKGYPRAFFAHIKASEAQPGDLETKVIALSLSIDHKRLSPD
jgi:hypothetical protein